jgi:hypothetical protein
MFERSELVGLAPFQSEIVPVIELLVRLASDAANW